ncbi:hypothetical protein [Streptomyces sp. TP-A0356]|uniref:hypothetical protein n=1 Tax=Streptomyces sp. TP-A0356 TaxID=1359208 RepID=UPI0006E283D3|nr:hypothetical protein [Streptomyces sp. TP-A0356]
MIEETAHPVGDVLFVLDAICEQRAAASRLLHAAQRLREAVGEIPDDYTDDYTDDDIFDDDIFDDYTDDDIFDHGVD